VVGMEEVLDVHKRPYDEQRLLHVVESLPSNLSLRPGDQFLWPGEEK